MRRVSKRAADWFHPSLPGYGKYLGLARLGATAPGIDDSREFHVVRICPNTRVLSYGSSVVLALHGNLIAARDDYGKVSISLAGYPTPTTSDRLRAVLKPYDLTISKMGGRYFLWRGGLPMPLPDDGWVTVVLPDNHPDRTQLKQPELIAA